MKTVRCYASLIWKLAKIACSKEPNKDAEYRRAIFYSFKEWGGVYIKFLQVMAGASKFMEGWGGPREMEVFSQAPREDLNLADYIDLKNFVAVSAEPVAAGSFALVYRGTLVSGEDVAIKVLRPSIKQGLKRNLAVLGRLCKFFTHFLPQTLVDYNEAYAACAKMFALETDYRREIANQEFFAQFYQGHPRVVIPKIYRELSSRDMIVQDFIAGPTLADVMSKSTPEKPASQLTKELTGSDLWEQVVIAGGEALYTAMCADYVYGDPHPGNIILLPDNRIALIDFGIIANRPRSHRAFYDWVRSYYDILNETGGFKRLLETSVICFCPDIALAMQRCNFGEEDLLAVLSDAITEKLDHEMNGNISYLESFKAGHLADVFIKVVGTKVIEVKIDMVNFELMKAIQAFLGSVTILDNSENRHGFAETMFKSMEYALTNAQLKGIPHDNVSSTRLGLTESYELLVRTISALADNDEYMFDLVRERIFV